MDGNIKAKGADAVAHAYLEYLYSQDGQSLAAKHYYIPFKPELADPNDLKRCPDVELVTVGDFGGWRSAQPKFFGDGGIFDQIYRPGR